MYFNVPKSSNLCIYVYILKDYNNYFRTAKDLIVEFYHFAT